MITTALHVPTLLALACGATAAVAADPPAPAVTFHGWVDTVFGAYHANVLHDQYSTSGADNAWKARFSAAACVKSRVAIDDQVSGRIDVRISPEQYAAAEVREAAIRYQPTGWFGVEAGKFLTPLGLLPSDPTGQYTVNRSLISYADIYGADPMGINVAITPTGSRFRLQLLITNGFFSESNAENITPLGDGVPGYSATNYMGWYGGENHDLGYGLTCEATLPGGLGAVGIDAAYDRHARLNGRALSPDQNGTYVSGLSGNVLYLGLHAQFRPSTSWLVGAEILTRQLGNSDNENVDDQGGLDRSSSYQGLLMTNCRLPVSLCPMSLTAMWQHSTAFNSVRDWGFNDGPGYTNRQDKDAFQLALLTNPTGRRNLGLNLELGLWTRHLDGEQPSAGGMEPERIRGWTASLQALLMF